MTDMTEGRVITYIESFYKKLGVKPDRIYLGRLDIRDLAAQTGHVYFARKAGMAEDGFCGFTFAGIPVYELNLDRHLGVGYNPPGV